MRRLGTTALALWLVIIGVIPVAAADDKPVTAQLQHLIDTYLRDRRDIEGISGLTLLVDRGAGRPIISLTTGTDGRTPPRPLGPHALYQIGSNTKHFTAALILKLEAQGVLNINQTVGRWLPHYPAWKDVTIRSLLSMTAPIPNYSETEEIGEKVAANLNHQFSFTDLVGAVNPDTGKTLPTPSGWFYSNTNNILAAMIIEAATHTSYKDALETMLLRPQHLRDTFYSNGAYPPAVQARIPRGLYENRACLDYQPKPCGTSTLAPLIGKDVSHQNLSWAGPAGAIVASPADLARWIRALFGLRVIPGPQLAEMMTLVSRKTGKPIQDVSPEDPLGFGLDLGRVYDPAAKEAFWFYEGETLGFRMFFVYWPQYDLVMTAMANSQPPEGEDTFGTGVISPALTILKAAGLPRHDTPPH